MRISTMITSSLIVVAFSSCSSDPEPKCGDGAVDQQIGEVCDDGNIVNGDGCSSTCMSDETCGNQILDVGESCEDGNTVDGDGCSSSCVSEYCGNDQPDLNEVCDDGNTVDGDGCSATCASDETCGNRVLDAGEACDDGNAVDGDGCSRLCTFGVLPVISAGLVHSCALLNRGGLKCWGGNTFGQLGLGDTNNRGDRGSEMGSLLPAVKLGTGRVAVAVAAGNEHTCALLSDGGVKCWGRNNYGQLGFNDVANANNWGDGPNEMGDDLPDVELGTNRTALSISAGEAHTCAVLDNFSIKCWGRNSHGQLGLGDADHRGDSVDEMGDALPEVSLGSGRTALAVRAGAFHTCALLDDNSVKCWGRNTDGELGQGDASWRGDGSDEMGDNLLAVNLGTGLSVRSLEVDGGHACVILNTGALKCWGANAQGELGYGDANNWGTSITEMGDNLSSVKLGTGRTVKAVVVGDYHSCALLDDDTVKCWGGNSSGQLGLGDTDNRGDDIGEMASLSEVELGNVSETERLTVVALMAGEAHTCALFAGETLKCWGANASGQLGLGYTTVRGDDTAEMGDNLLMLDLGR